MAQHIKFPAANHDDLSLIPAPTWWRQELDHGKRESQQ